MVDMCKLLLPLTMLTILVTGMDQATQDQTKLYDEKGLQELQTENDRLRSEEEARKQMKELLDRQSQDQKELKELLDRQRQDQKEVHEKRMCNLKELHEQKEELIEFVASINNLRPLIRSFLPADLVSQIEDPKISDWKSWTEDDVYKWIRGFGSHPAYKRVATKMREYGITGNELWAMMFDYFGLGEGRLMDLSWKKADDDNRDAKDRRMDQMRMEQIRSMGFLIEGHDEKIAFDKMHAMVGHHFK